MARRGAHDLGIALVPWIDTVATQIVETFPTPPHDAPRELTTRVAELIEAASEPKSDPVFAWIRGRGTSRWNGPSVAVRVPIAMGDAPWPVPSINTVAEAARFFGLDQNELEWYADVRSLERSVTDENLRHYNYTWRSKRSGGVRLLEAPKQNLKSFQRVLLRRVLRAIPTHDAAHGFCQGRSIQSFATPHVNRAVVIRMDLRAFFTSIPAGRVFGTLRTAGYPEDVAHVLTGLTTNTTPHHVLADGRAMEHHAPAGIEFDWLRGPHLPQGAPTSPALANLAAFGLDRRLAGLAEAFEANYTRYADDLAFSGGPRLARAAQKLIGAVDEIVRDEGFHVNQAKNRVRTQTQRQVLAGLVVNEHLNVHRRDYDQLKAIVHEACVHGPAIANRHGHPAFRSHLEGRIGFVQATNPNRARRLWRDFDKIAW